MISLKNVVLMVLFFSVLAGCGTDRFYVHRDSTLEVPKKVAVLPFENLTQDPLAAERVRRVVIAELLVRGIDVVEPGEVLRVLRESDIPNLQSISIKDIKALGRELEVDGIIMGSVSAYGIRRGIEGAYPEVTLHLMLLDPSTGRILWSAWRTEGGPTFWMSYFGTKGATLNETAKRVVRDAIDTLFAKGES